MDNATRALYTVLNPQQLIEQYAGVIEELKTLNVSHGPVVIGGSIALQLHGLIPARRPQDIDLIVYNPSKKTLAYILSGMGIADDGHHLQFDEYLYTTEEGVPEDKKVKADPSPRRSYRFTIAEAEMSLNVLVETETPAPKEESMLEFSYRSKGLHHRHFYVQGIREIIEAKKRYNREKDKFDLKEIAKNNF